MALAELHERIRCRRSKLPPWYDGRGNTSLRLASSSFGNVPVNRARCVHNQPDLVVCFQVEPMQNLNLQSSKRPTGNPLLSLNESSRKWTGYPREHEEVRF